MTKKIIIALISLIICIGLGLRVWPQPKYQPHMPSDYFISQAQGFYIPDLPDGWTFKYFTPNQTSLSANGQRLRWGESDNQDMAKATLVFVLGFGGFSEMVAEQISLLIEREYHVVVFEARGMGGSDRDIAANPEKMSQPDFKIYADDFEQFYKETITPSAKPVMILASSFGAHFSMRSIAENKLKVDGYVALAPAFVITSAGFARWQYNAMLSTYKMLGFGHYYAPTQRDWQPYSEDLSQSMPCGTYPIRLYRRDVLLGKHPELRTGGATINWLWGIRDSYRNFINTPTFTQGMDVPMTVLLADEDAYVLNEPIIHICDMIENCDYAYMEKTRHCAIAERDEVLDQIFGAADDLYDRVSEL